MKYALFGQGEGVRAACAHPVWASVRQGIVTDASVSARMRGIRPGMRQATAEALVSDVVCCPESAQPEPVMEAVWRTIWKFSPWLETVNHDAFFLQMPGRAAPLREVRLLLQQLDGLLSDEQRVRTGLAETPFLARALVEWSRWERVPAALYRKAGRQQLIVSPGIAVEVQAAAGRQPAASLRFGAWIGRLPIQAMWLLPEQARTALLQFGVRRLGELTEVGADRLRRHFGKEAFGWLHLLQPDAAQTVRVNYPPPERAETWRANVDEPVDRRHLPALVETLASALSMQLERAELGALAIGVRWETDAGSGGFERLMKRPTWRRETILAQLGQGLETCTESRLESVTVYGRDLRPCSSIQLRWEVRDGALMQADGTVGENLRKLVGQVNRKYPNGIRIGMRPGFRELRLQAVLGTGTGSAVGAVLGTRAGGAPNGTVHRP